MKSLRILRQAAVSTRRLRAGCPPLVEGLEVRQLLSGIQGNHIGVTSAPMAVGQHIGSEMVSFAFGKVVITYEPA
jgi:hypothetical protein